MSLVDPYFAYLLVSGHRDRHNRLDLSCADLLSSVALLCSVALLSTVALRNYADLLNSVVAP